MAAINTGGPAFPEPFAISPTGDTYPAYSGMTLRDWFAGQALAGMVASGITIDMDGDVLGIGRARTAYALADAMIAARCE